jgi:hypothetical protein
MMRNRRTYIVITGGLGNQLFQYIAGLAFCEEGELRLDLTLGNLRTGNKGSSPLERIHLKENVNILQASGSTNWNGRIYLYLLRVSTNPSKFESSRIWRHIIGLCSSIYFSAYFKDVLKVVISEGIGYFEPSRSKMNCLYVGYFQSYKYLEKYGNDFEVVPKKLSETLIKLFADSSGTRVLMVHIRLGDYLLEKSFGNLSPDYYRKALDYHFSTSNFDELWIFSEDVEAAQSYIPREFISKSKFIQDIDNDEIYSLLAMSRADGFVIANSTFSWWGATLNDKLSTKVTFPDPWFTELSPPKDLCSSSWRRIEAFES